MRNFPSALVIATTLLSSQIVAAKPTAWNLQPGAEFFAEWNTIAVQQLRITGQYTHRMRELTVVARIRVTESTVDRTRLDVTVRHVALRSAGPASGPAPAELLRGCHATVQLTKELAVESIDGLDSVDHPVLSQIPADQRRAILATLRGELTEWLEQLFVPVPANHADWSRTIQPPSTPGFRHQLRYTAAPDRAGHYTLNGTRRRNDDDPRARAEALEVISERLQGELQFDPARGRLVQSRVLDQAEVRGKPPEAKDNESFACAVRAVSTIRVLDSNPLDENRRPVPVANTTGKPRSWTNSIGMKMVELPPGQVAMGRMGAGAAPNSEMFQAVISRPFSIGMYEVTIGQYRQFTEETGYRTSSERNGTGAFGFNPGNGKIETNTRFSWKKPGWEHDENHPAVNLSWEDARAFCDWLARKEGKPYRLPYEAEWEYAARAGTETRYSCGDDPESLSEYGNIADASAKKFFPKWTTLTSDDGRVFTAPVGSFKPNAFGIYDMLGNALEWCEDWAWLYPVGGAVDPVGPPVGLDRVQRGGSFADFPHQSTCASRSSFRPEDYCVSSGFRVVVSEQPVAPYTPKPSWRGRLVVARDSRIMEALEESRGALRPLDLPIFFVADDRLGLMRLIADAMEFGAPQDDFILADEAEPYFTKKIETEPTAHHHILRAAARAARGDLAGALADLGVAIRDRPDDATIRCARARMLIKQRQFAAARQDLKKAVDLRPDSPHTHNALARLLATCPDDTIRDPQEALRLAKKAYELTTSRDGFVLDTLGVAHAACGDFENAIKKIEEAIKDSAFRGTHEEAARERIASFKAGHAIRGIE